MEDTASKTMVIFKDDPKIARIPSVPLVDTIGNVHDGMTVSGRIIVSDGTELLMFRAEAFRSFGALDAIIKWKTTDRWRDLGFEVPKPYRINIGRIGPFFSFMLKIEDACCKHIADLMDTSVNPLRLKNMIIESRPDWIWSVIDSVEDKDGNTPAEYREWMREYNITRVKEASRLEDYVDNDRLPAFSDCSVPHSMTIQIGIARVNLHTEAACDGRIQCTVRIWVYGYDGPRTMQFDVPVEVTIFDLIRKICSVTRCTTFVDAENVTIHDMDGSAYTQI